MALALRVTDFAEIAAILPPAPVYTGPTYHDAIRAIAAEQLNGDDTDERIALLADAFQLDISSVYADVVEMIDLISN